MESATQMRQDEDSGRWVVETSHEGRSWEVVVEPDPVDRLLVVITAYAVEL